MNEIIKNKHEYLKDEDIMEALLEFTLPEEQYKFMVASKAAKVRIGFNILSKFA
jgi:hypothetical protein